jgi:hypothetical protein
MTPPSPPVATRKPASTSPASDVLGCDQDRLGRRVRAHHGGDAASIQSSVMGYPCQGPSRTSVWYGTSLPSVMWSEFGEGAVDDALVRPADAVPDHDAPVRAEVPRADLRRSRPCERSARNNASGMPSDASPSMRLRASGAGSRPGA